MPGSQSTMGGLNIISASNSLISSSVPSEDGLQGYSSSSSSSIYQHPFSSFTFAPSTSSDTPSSLSSRMKEASLSPKVSFSQRAHAGADQTVTNLNGPPSPATSFTGSQHSMEEYDTDSPSSLCSWSSFVNGQRGELADVEDLELGEPELETVSELDEENISNNGSDGPVLESDDDFRAQQPEILRFGESLRRRRTVTQHGGASQHHHLHNQLVGQSGHGLPHFSPRSGGHGLSHHSRWTSRIPASVVARRRKGRIAELAEEGAGDVITGNVGINTTKMPSREAAEQSTSNAPSSPNAHSAVPSRPGECSANYGAPPCSQWSEFPGPPALPVRSVSPSETVPVVPSPLCEFISASMTESGELIPSHTDVMTREGSATINLSGQSMHINNFEQAQAEVTTPTAPRIVGERTGFTSPSVLAIPTARRGVLDSATANDLAVGGEDGEASPPVSAASPVRSFATEDNKRPVSPEITPPTSPTQPFVRKSSVRPRRSSSPVQTASKPKVPLRPCFSRRGSTQSGRSTRESSVERERGRCHVRFSPAPPQTIRTHSPIEYDRSSCAVHNRLSIEDVEELHKLEMDMGLLAAKCSAIAAITSCKLPKKIGASLPSSGASTSSVPSPATSPITASSWSPSQGNRDNLAPEHATVQQRPGVRRIRAPTLPGGFDKVVAAETLSPEGILSPAEHLRIQREKERERACIMAGIGTGLGGRNLGHGLKGQITNPLIARFGLTTPPPPLPSASLGSLATVGGSRSAPPTPYEMPSTPGSEPHKQVNDIKTSMAVSVSDRSRSPRASSLQRTPNEERAMLRSMAFSNRAVAAAVDDSETECDEPRGAAVKGGSGRVKGDAAAISLSRSRSTSPPLIRGRLGNRRDTSGDVAAGPSTPSAIAQSLPNFTTTSPTPSPSSRVLTSSDHASDHPDGGYPSPDTPTPAAADAATPLWSASSHSSPSRASDSYFSHKAVHESSHKQQQRQQQTSSPHSSSYIESPCSTPRSGSSSPWMVNPSALYGDHIGGDPRGVSGRRGEYDSPGSGFESGSEYDLLR